MGSSQGGGRLRATPISHRSENSLCWLLPWRSCCCSSRLFHQAIVYGPCNKESHKPGVFVECLQLGHRKSDQCNDDSRGQGPQGAHVESILILVNSLARIEVVN